MVKKIQKATTATSPPVIYETYRYVSFKISMVEFVPNLVMKICLAHRLIYR